jgi:hypothetical protein
MLQVSEKELDYIRGQLYKVFNSLEMELRKETGYIDDEVVKTAVHVIDGLMMQCEVIWRREKGEF